MIHHTQEDDFIFKFMRARLNDPNFLTTESSEHEVLHRMLENLAVAVTKKDLSGARLILGEIHKMFCESLDSNHLAREEAVLTSDLLRRNCTQEEIKKLSDDIHGIIPTYMDKTKALVFMIYHLNDTEKAFFDERLPCILTKFIFPKK